MELIAEAQLQLTAPQIVNKYCMSVFLLILVSEHARNTILLSIGFEN